MPILVEIGRHDFWEEVENKKSLGRQQQTWTRRRYIKRLNKEKGKSLSGLYMPI